MKIADILKKLGDTGRQCVYCGREIPSNLICCADCAKEEALLTSEEPRAGGVWHIYNYDGAIKKMIYRLKYGDMPNIALYMAQRMYEFTEQQGIDADIISFVPVHDKRKKQRGYDQCELLAKHLGELMEKPVRLLVRRIKNTKPQYDLSGKERFNNVRGAFQKTEEDIRGKTVLLLDDILTTGATMGACTQALEESIVIPFAYSKDN